MPPSRRILAEMRVGEGGEVSGRGVAVVVAVQSSLFDFRPPGLRLRCSSP
jgi:hypothetical protein